MPRSLRIPSHTGIGPVEELDKIYSLVIIGANGSGKSKMGHLIARINSEVQGSNVLRVSAEKPLTINPNLEELERSYRNRGPVNFNEAIQTTSFVEPEGEPQYNLEYLIMGYIQEERKQADAYFRQVKIERRYIERPITLLDRLEATWEKVFPNLKLDFDMAKGKFTVLRENDKQFEAKHLSDGERTIFYQIGHLLHAPENCIIVVDEPELHLNKALQIMFWNEMENLRDDCLFVYLTHDIEFAESRVRAKKIVLTEFIGGYEWKWQEIPSMDAIPEDVMLKISGSPLPILLVEGDLDAKVYSILYPECYVIPVENCEKVIAIARALQGVEVVRDKKIIGLIDRDQRTNDELENLEKLNVHALKVSELENLFWTPEFIAEYERRDRKTDGDYMQQAEDRLMDYLSQNLENLVNQHLDAELSRQTRDKLNLSGITTNAELQQHFDAIVSQIYVEDLRNRIYQTLRTIVDQQDYERALALFPLKEQTSMLMRPFNLGKPEEFQQYVLNALSDEEVLRNTLRERYFPDLDI
ncbi:MAG: AAA family ATPase [Chloroflexi bacterium]|nr:AAA family ATPase [Chloroflexota bacterium]